MVPLLLPLRMLGQFISSSCFGLNKLEAEDFDRFAEEHILGS